MFLSHHSCLTLTILSFPQLTIIKEILSKETKTKYYEFLYHMSKHDLINNLIGRHNNNNNSKRFNF